MIKSAYPEDSLARSGVLRVHRFTVTYLMHVNHSGGNVSMHGGCILKPFGAFYGSGQ